MVSRELFVAYRSCDELAAELDAIFHGIDPDAVLRLRIDGEPGPEAAPVLRAAALRALAPDTMNVELSFTSAGQGWRARGDAGYGERHVVRT